MAFINPVYTLIVPFVFVVTVPLAVFAGITTTLAFSVLIFRVLVVYLDIALSLVPQYFASRKGRVRHPQPHHLRSDYEDDQRSLSPAGSAGSNYDEHGSPTPTHHLHQPIYRRRRRRPSSATSIVSAGSTTPVGDVGLGILPSIGPERDFEGIGGWRSGQDDDETWTTINSRFEYLDRSHPRNHHRTPSAGAGAVTPGDSGVLMMKARRSSPDARDAKPSASPNSARARTPSSSRMSVISMANSDGYFPLGMAPTSTKKLPTHTN